MRKFMEKHPVVTGLMLYSLISGLVVEVAEAIKPNVTVVIVEPEDIPAPDKKEN